MAKAELVLFTAFLFLAVTAMQKNTAHKMIRLGREGVSARASRPYNRPQANKMVRLGRDQVHAPQTRKYYRPEANKLVRLGRGYGEGANLMKNDMFEEVMPYEEAQRFPKMDHHLK